MLFCGKDKLILPTRMSRFKYSGFLHILRHSEAKMFFVSLSSCFCFHLDRSDLNLSSLLPLGHFRSLTASFFKFSINFDNFDSFLDYSRLLSITLDYSRLLSITLDYSRLLSTTLGYSRLPSITLSIVLDFFLLASSLFDGF